MTSHQQLAKLRPRARIIRTIGDQLISGPEAAVIELVKNAFDADASSVDVRISPSSPTFASGQIVIADTGHGMTPDVVLNRWFEPATDDKLKRTISPGGRTMLGAKGIGRFAAARLGLRASLTSVAKAEDGSQLLETALEIDWERFEEDTYLDLVEVPVTTRTLPPRAEARTGVRLEISALRDTWTKKRVESLVRELRRVALPAAETETPFLIRLDLSGFTRETAGFDGKELFAELNRDLSAAEEPALGPGVIRPFGVNQHADYKVLGHFSSSGDFEGTFCIVRGDRAEQKISFSSPSLTSDEVSCGALDIELNIYDREPEAVADLFRRMGLDFDEIGIRAARKILSDAAGIGIFRGGFRIRPYGDPETDWLELERQRVQNPSKKLGLSQVSGKVVIGPPEVSGLLERSSREGLEHNGSFERLKGLVASLLIHIEERRLAFREKAGLSRRVVSDVESAKALAALPTVAQAIDKTPEPHRSPLRRAAEKDSTAIAASLEEIDSYQKLLQSRAALGLVVAQIIHEGRRLLNPMAASAKGVGENAGHLLDDSKLGSIVRKQLPTQLAVIVDGTKQLSRLFKRLDPLSGRKRGRPRTFDIHDVVQSSLALFSDVLASSGIEVTVRGGEDAVGYGYPEDFQAALMNIVENAIHWLSTSTADSRELTIEISTSDDATHTCISNNGPPIDENYVPRLFQAGFSLRSEGTGLGLAIAKQACHSSNGDVRFIGDEDQTAFVIDFPVKKT